MFDLGEAPWGDDPPFGMPVFIVTHRARDTVTKQGGTTYAFVTDAIEAALAQQYLNAGALDEVLVHLVPVLLGDGVRLFENLVDLPRELECTKVVGSAAATHLTFRVV